jgi:hypothetical protein
MLLRGRGVLEKESRRIDLGEVEDGREIPRFIFCACNSVASRLGPFQFCEFSCASGGEQK